MRHIFTADYWTKFFEEASAKALHSAVQIAFIVVLLLVARAILFRVIARTMGLIVSREEALGRTGAAARARTLGGLLRSVTGYVLVFVAGLMILRAVGFELATLLTAAGVVGLAIGFGAQKLVRDVISGFFILLENQYAVGDYVTIGATTGVVEDMGMRTTRIRDEVGKLTIISNGDITQVTNYSRGDLLTSIDVSVAPDSDMDKVSKLLRQVGAKFAQERADVLGPFTCDGVAAMDGTKVTLRLVGCVEPKVQQDVQLDLRQHVRAALLENGIQIA